MTTDPTKSNKTVSIDSKRTPTPESRPAIDRNAPAGTPNSLGEESVRDGRPSTKDEVVEAKDEMPPGTPS
jgi:hypothetical protein